MFCVMCAIDIFLNKIMKSKFCVKKCQENLLQFMFLYIIRTPLLELKSVGKKCGLYTGKDGKHDHIYFILIIIIFLSFILNHVFKINYFVFVFLY